jgi:putative solute:sodium symporter small subunit
VSKSEKKKALAWNVVLVWAIVGLGAFITDIFYHMSMDEISAAIGETPFEMFNHSTALIMYIAIILTYIWQRSQKS